MRSSVDPALTDDATSVTPVPVEDNAVMIYSDLGVYAGENLGTPCDDM